MCPRTTLYVDTYALRAMCVCSWVLIVTDIYRYIPIYVSSYYSTFSQLTSLCQLTAIYVSTYYYIRVLILLYVCPHATIYVSSYYYTCVLMLLYILSAHVALPTYIYDTYRYTDIYTYRYTDIYAIHSHIALPAHCSEMPAFFFEKKNLKTNTVLCLYACLLLLLSLFFFNIFFKKKIQCSVAWLRAYCC